MNGSSDEIIHSTSDDPEVERMPHREGEEEKVVTMARTMAHTAKKLLEQFRAVVPMTVYLFLFLFLVLRGRMGKAQMVSVCLGVVCLVQGLTLFLEGLQWGLMPLSERIGGSLAFRLRLPAVLLICFLFGIGVTLAEPAIAALQIIGFLHSPITNAVQLLSHLPICHNRFTCESGASALSLYYAHQPLVGSCYCSGYWCGELEVFFNLKYRISFSIHIHIHTQHRELQWCLAYCDFITRGA